MKIMHLRTAVCLLTLLSFAGIYSCKRDSPKDTTLLLQSFSPEQGSKGETIELKGQNFSSTKDKNTVKFNGLPAIVSGASNDGSSITVVIPEGAVTGKITVKVGDQEVVSTKDFVVVPLVTAITDFNPKFGEPGTTVVISGKNFDPSSTILLGVMACNVIKVEANAITLKVPDQSNMFSGIFTISFRGEVLKTASEFEVTNVWKPVNTTTTLKHQEGTAFTIGNKIYVAGGDYNSDIDEFDVATGKWTKVNVFPAALTDANLGSVLVKDNKAYMGNFYTAVIAGAWFEFNPALAGTAAFRQLTDFPVKTYGGIAFNLNNQLYAGLGSNDANSISKFDAAANNGKGSWINSFSPASNNRFYSAHFVINGVGYYGGGFDKDINLSKEFYKFDPAVSTNTVTRLKDLPAAVALAPGFTLKGKGYVVIGTKPYEYSTVNNSWTETKYPVNEKPSWVQVVNDKAYAITPVGQVYEYIPKP